jgi:hypothetical protein
MMADCLPREYPLVALAMGVEEEKAAGATMCKSAAKFG